MTQPLDANAWLMSGGIPSIKLGSIGETVGGVITDDPQVRQQIDFDTREPLWWPEVNGVRKPREQIVITIQTTERDPALPHDTGVRSVYVKGYNLDNLRTAVRASGANGIHRGGYLQVTYARDGARDGNKNPPHLFDYLYTPPAAQQANALLANGTPPAPAPAYTPPAPAPTPQFNPAQPLPGIAPPAAAPVAAAMTAMSDEAKAALRAVGIDPATMQPISA